MSQGFLLSMQTDDEEINDKDYVVELYKIKDGDNKGDDEVDNDEGDLKSSRVQDGCWSWKGRTYGHKGDNDKDKGEKW